MGQFRYYRRGLRPFLSRMTQGLAVPSLFYEHFSERSFLFLGYSLCDWNTRVVLRNLAKYFPTQLGKAMTFRPPGPSKNIPPS